MNIRTGIAKKLVGLNDASREPSITSFARVMYQKVISANPEILTRNFLQERRNYRMEKWTCLGAHRVDLRIRYYSHAVCTRAKSAKSKINSSSGTTDVIRGKTAQRRITNGHNDRTIQLLCIRRQRSLARR